MTDHSPAYDTETAVGIRDDSSSRRRFLVGGAAAALAAFTAACSNVAREDAGSNSTTGSAPSDNSGETKVNKGDIEGGRDPNNPTAVKASAALAGDLPVATFAAGLEVLAVNTYKAAREAALAGKLGDVPPAVLEFITTVMGHHQAALDQWNRALALGGKPEVAKPDSGLDPVVGAALKGVKDTAGAARLALMLEDIAAATYLAAIPKLKAPESIALAASIQPIDMQHAAVLHFVLGEYPVPDVFAKTEKAATPA